LKVSGEAEQGSGKECGSRFIAPEIDRQRLIVLWLLAELMRFSSRWNVDSR
jgi:hypothetical protein